MSLAYILSPGNGYDLYARSFNGAQGNFTQGVQGPIIADRLSILTQNSTIVRPYRQITGNTTLNAADVINGIVESNVNAPGTPQVTLPSASTVISALQGPVQVGTSFSFLLGASGTAAVSLFGNPDGTFIVSGLPQATESASIIMVCRVANTDGSQPGAIVAY